MTDEIELEDLTLVELGYVEAVLQRTDPQRQWEIGRSVVDFSDATMSVVRRDCVAFVEKAAKLRPGGTEALFEQIDQKTLGQNFYRDRQRRRDEPDPSISLLDVELSELAQEFGPAHIEFTRTVHQP